MTSTPQHILFVVPSAYTLGGLATWLDYVLPGLRNLGWNITLGLVEGARYHKPAEYLKVHPDLQTVAITCTTGTELGRRQAVAKTVLRLQPDLVVTVNIPDALAAVAELRAAGKTKAKAVMTCHGIQPDLYADMYHLRNTIDAVVCTNRLACHFASELAGWNHSNIYHAPYGVNVISSKLSQEKRPIEKAPSEKLRIVYVGRLEQEQKLVFDLPAIVAGLNAREIDFELQIAGDGPDTETLKSQLANAVASQQVIFLGRVPAEEIATRVYPQADVMIMPSLWETGPIVIWEAMTHHVAVVTSRYIGSGREQLLHHEQNCLLYDLGNPDQAAEQLARLTHETSLYDHIIEQGKKTIASKLTHAISTENWSQIFQSIIKASDKTLQPLESRYLSQGRLTRLLGVQLAELIRSALGKKGPDAGAGSEWPHALPGFKHPETIPRNDSFWEFAKQKDQRESSAT